MFAYIVIVFMCVTNLYAQKEIGDSCQTARIGAAGTCKLISDCPAAIEDFQNNRQPAICGFRGRDAIICCANPVTEKPPPKKSNRLSSRKCKEYEGAAYETLRVPDGPFNYIEQKVLRCHSSNVPLVIGGVDANEKEFPHMALIGYRQQLTDEISFNCAGSLISDRFVLTAAHCVNTTRLVGPPVTVRLGEYDKSAPSPGVQDISIAEYIPYPSYRRITKYNDIGLIKLSRPVQFSEYIRPACLPEEYSTNTLKAVATGWGRTDVFNATSDILQKVILDLYNDQECRNSFIAESRKHDLRNGIVSDTQFCAGSRNERKDVCQGDSGGPIQINHPYNTCMYTISGVTSFGKKCSYEVNSGTVGIYTRVFSFLDWIEQVVWPGEE